MTQKAENYNGSPVRTTKSKNFTLVFIAIGIGVFLLFWFPSNRSGIKPLPAQSQGMSVSNVKNSMQQIIVENKILSPGDDVFSEKPKPPGFFESVKQFVANPLGITEKAGGQLASTGKLFKGEIIREFPPDELIFDVGRPEVDIRPVPPEPWCTKWAVVTTIFTMAEAVMRQAKSHEWCTVIVGDKKTPSNYGDSLPLDSNSAVTVYLTPDDQILMKHDFVDIVPWNNFGRKNVGYLYAIEHGAQMIWDFDDDNLLRFFVKGARPPTFPSLTVSDTTNVTVRKLDAAANYSKNVINPLEVLGGPKNLWPRGFPLRKIRIRETWNFTSKLVKETVTMDRIAVLQSLADIQPDIDAVGRLVAADIPVWFKRLNETTPLLFPKNVYTPYNAQATLHFYKAFGALLLPITVSGRVSDIWRSYFSQNLFFQYGMQVGYYARPMVVQQRNEHNLLADFQAEEHVYQRAEVLVDFLANWTSNSSDFCQKMEELWVTMYNRGYIEINDVKMMQAWLTSLVKIGYRFPGDKKWPRPPKKFAKSSFQPLWDNYGRINSDLKLKNEMDECGNVPRKQFYLTKPSKIDEIAQSALIKLNQSVVVSKIGPKTLIDALIEANVSQKALDIFYKEKILPNIDVIKSYALVCNSGCNYWFRSRLPIVFVFNTGLCTETDWKSVNSLLTINKNEKYIFASTSNLESRIFEYFTDNIPTIAFNHHKKIDFSKDMINQRSPILIFGNITTLKLYEHTLIPGDSLLNSSSSGFSFLRQVQQVKAAIFVPNTLNDERFQLLYSMTIPLFVPYANSTLAQTSLIDNQRGNCTQPYNRHKESIHPYDPYRLIGDLEAQRYWLQFSDYYTYPHITYFSDAKDLEWKLADANLQNARDLMKLENQQRRLKLDAFWCKTIEKMENLREQ